LIGTSAPAGPTRLFHADRGDARERLDLVLVRHLADLPEVSRTRIQAWIEGGLVRVNGEAAAKAAERVGQGDAVEVVLPPPPPPPRPRAAAEELPLALLYEDEQLLAVDKPAGLVVHPAFGHRRGTLVNALLWHARAWGEGARRPSLVHRLDKDTSGVLLVAKTAAAHASLVRAMKARTVRKEYLAIVYGRPRQASGKIERRIGRDPGDRRRMAAVASEGREARTLYERLATTPPGEPPLSLLRCFLQTGRTHQIRVHLQAHGLPLVGDPLYSAPRHKGIADPALAALCRGFPRQALHAHRLTIRHPATGVALTFEAPIPTDFAELAAAAGLAVPTSSGALRSSAVGVEWTAEER
jgi:23S rRNA pseudouridine1911/1915/1917 synthase